MKTEDYGLKGLFANPKAEFCPISTSSSDEELDPCPTPASEILSTRRSPPTTNKRNLPAPLPKSKKLSWSTTHNLVLYLTILILFCFNAAMVDEIEQQEQKVEKCARKVVWKEETLDFWRGKAIERADKCAMQGKVSWKIWDDGFQAGSGFCQARSQAWMGHGQL